MQPLAITDARDHTSKCSSNGLGPLDHSWRYPLCGLWATGRLAINNSPMTGVIDINAFPHVVDAILDFALADEVDPAWPLTLGTVCRAWHKRVSRKIGYHLHMVDNIVGPDNNNPVKRWDPVHDERDGRRYASQTTESTVLGADRDIYRVLREPSKSMRALAGNSFVEFEVLRPALYPRYNVCDLYTGVSIALVREAKVLTVSSTCQFSMWNSGMLAQRCPQLRTLRVITTDYRSTPKHFPHAKTYVWLRAPDRHLHVHAVAALCHKDTKKIVFVNRATPWLAPSHVRRVNPSRLPTLSGPENVFEVVFVLFARPSDGVEHWMQWSINCRFRTTIVLASEEAELCWQDFKRHDDASFVADDLMTVLTADSYKELVGEEVFLEETELYLSPTEFANKDESKDVPALPNSGPHAFA